MKGQDRSDLHNELSVTTRPATEPGFLTLTGESDIKVRNTVWARFCLRHRTVTEATEFACPRVELPQIDGPTEIRIAASFSGGKQMSGTLFFVPSGDIDPLPVTSYHHGEIASLRGGYCLLVPISEDMVWTPNIWPATIEELNTFVANLTDSPRYLEAWVMQRCRESNQLLMVVVIQGNICYGYLLGSPKTGGFAEIRVIPIFFERVGELTRQSPVLVELELYVNHLESLLRHARQFQPSSDDTQENRRLREALDELADALENSATSCATKGA